MSVYKEAFYAVAEIQKYERPIWDDTDDYRGVPTNKGDYIWNLAARLGIDFGDPATRKVTRVESGVFACVEVAAMAEDGSGQWQYWRLHFVNSSKRAIRADNRDFEGFVALETINRRTLFSNRLAEGGETGWAGPKSEEHKRRIGEANRGNKRPDFGRKEPPKCWQKINSRTY